MWLFVSIISFSSTDKEFILKEIWWLGKKWEIWNQLKLYGYCDTATHKRWYISKNCLTSVKLVKLILHDQLFVSEVFSIQPYNSTFCKVFERFTKSNPDPSEAIGFWNKMRIMMRIRIYWLNSRDLVMYNFTL